MTEHDIYLNSLDAAEGWARKLLAGMKDEGMHCTAESIAAHCLFALTEKLRTVEAERDEARAAVERERDESHKLICEAVKAVAEDAKELSALKEKLAAGEADWTRRNDANLSLLAEVERLHDEVAALRADLATEREMREAAEAYIAAIPAMCNGDFSAPCALHVRAPIEALRAELERKDAALKAALTLDDLNALENMGSPSESDQASVDIRNVFKTIRAALQPKEPPCKA